MLSINTNPNAIFSIANLNKTNRDMSRLSKQMSTGKRITSAKIDPSGSSIASKMDSRVRGMKVALKNVADANSLLGIADGGLQGIESSLQKMRELALSAKSDTLSSDERSALKDQFDAVVAEIDDYESQATFNGISLLDGSADLSIQSGADSTDTTKITISQDYSSTGLSVNALTIDSATNAGSAITAIDAALKLANEGMSKIGALSNRFDSQSDYLNTAIENNSAALSRIEDLDYAQASAENLALQTKNQANVYSLQQAIQLPTQILNLLG